MAVRDWWMEPPTESPGRAAENRTPQPHQPMMHRQLFQHKTYRQTLQIYACVITMYTCLQKNFLYSVFIYSQPTYIYCVVCLFVFLPLKRMSCMSHFGTLHRKEKKRKRTVCFCSFLFRQESFHLNLYKCITSCLFFLIPSWKRFLLMPKEQTSSTRLQLQVLLVTLIRMEIRPTEAHRKLIITMKLDSCPSHSTSLLHFFQCQYWKTIYSIQIRLLVKNGNHRVRRLKKITITRVIIITLQTLILPHVVHTHARRLTQLQASSLDAPAALHGRNSQ